MIIKRRKFDLWAFIIWAIILFTLTIITDVLVYHGNGTSLPRAILHSLINGVVAGIIIFRLTPKSK